MKKLLAIGAAALFLVLVFTPPAIAIDEEEPDAPIDTQKYGIAFIEGTVEDPRSINPGLNLLFQLLKINITIGFYGDLIEGTVKPRFAILKLREINIPGDFNRATLHGTFVKFTQYEKIGDTDHYLVNATAYNLRADLY